MILQAVFVSETIETVRSGPLCCGKHNQDRFPAAVGAVAPCPAEDAIAVLPHHVEAIIIANVEPTR
jgi:hypothetical protein